MSEAPTQTEPVVFYPREPDGGYIQEDLTVPVKRLWCNDVETVVACTAEEAQEILLKNYGEFENDDRGEWEVVDPNRNMTIGLDVYNDAPLFASARTFAYLSEPGILCSTEW